MADSEKVVSVYDTVDKARSALNVLKNSGIDTSDVSLLDRSSLGTGDQHAGLWRRLFGENEWQREAATYGDTLQRGGAVLAIRGSKERVAKIMSILGTREPMDIRGERAAKIGTEAPQAKVPVMTPGAAARMGVDKEEVLRLAEEQISVGKQIFETGVTRIRRFVTERPVEEKVSLHEERARVVRRPVNDPSYIGDIDWSDKEYTITETAEQAVVSKTARVIEEVAVGREGSEHTETVRDSVRRQEIEVEHLDTAKTKRAA